MDRENEVCLGHRASEDPRVRLEPRERAGHQEPQGNRVDPDLRDLLDPVDLAVRPGSVEPRDNQARTVLQVCASLVLFVAERKKY